MCNVRESSTTSTVWSYPLKPNILNIYKYTWLGVFTNIMSPGYSSLATSAAIYFSYSPVLFESLNFATNSFIGLNTSAILNKFIIYFAHTI